MFHRILAITLSLSVFWLGQAAILMAQEPKKDDKKDASPSLTDIHLEVEALGTLHALKATPEQMKQFQALAKQTSQPNRTHKDPMISDSYKQVLEDLHAALVLATDDDQIDNLYDQYEQLNKTDKPKFDDYEISEAARKAVPKVFSQFKASQIASVLAEKVDEIVDPQDRLIAALEEARKAPNDEWNNVRDEAAHEAATLAAGLDEAKEKRIRNRAGTLLEKARKMNEDEFKSQQPELEKEVKTIIGELGPMDILRNAVEYDLGRLLSNPRLAQVLKARLKGS